SACARSLPMCAKTGSAISRVFSSVTRSPFTKRASMPAFASAAVTCAPPPWTTTRRLPLARSAARRSARILRPLSDSMLLPPSFTTVIPGLCAIVIRSGGVIRVDLDVVVAEVAAPRGRVVLAIVQVDREHDRVLVHDAAQPVLVERLARLARAQHPRRARRALDLDVDLARIELRAAVADRREDAAPVGVAPEDRRLHERALRDAPGR